MSIFKRPSVVPQVFAAALLWATFVLAQSAPNLRLYVLDGGLLINARPESYGLTKADVAESDMSVPVFLIVHSRGSVLWDTGLGDDLINRPGTETGFGRVVTASVKDQLAAIGYTPDRITFLALSHTHFDHVGNSKDYLGSTLLMQRPEWQSVFADNLPRPPLEFARFSGLKTSKTVLLDGDHDVFGDGTVVIKSMPGHTPGHQSLFVNLPRTGPVVLAGDLYHYPAERVKHTMPPREAAEGVTAASRAAMEAFLAKTGATLWIQHDLVHWRQLKKSPEYYD